MAWPVLFWDITDLIRGIRCGGSHYSPRTRLEALRIDSHQNRFLCFSYRFFGGGYRRDWNASPLDYPKRAPELIGVEGAGLEPISGHFIAQGLKVSIIVIKEVDTGIR